MMLFKISVNLFQIGMNIQFRRIVGFGFEPMLLALLWQSLGCGVAAVLALAE
jgi:hypothetical protein